MILTVLTENMAGGPFLAEHGLSYLLACDEQKILFDTGHSDVFLQNAKKLGINIPAEIETIVLSHGHWDHGDGLQYLENKNLITHPSAFIKRYRKNDTLNIGLSLNKSELEQKYTLITSSSPYHINKNLIFLGEIPRLNDFEAQTTSFTDEEGNEDFIPDDSALAIIQNDEIIIITGCSHAGICNITKYAKKVCGINKVKAIMGGFHLKYNDQQTKKTIQYFRNQKIENIYPSHCTELPALSALYNSFGMQQVRTGMTLSF